MEHTILQAVIEFRGKKTYTLMNKQLYKKNYGSWVLQDGIRRFPMTTNLQSKIQNKYFIMWVI